MYGEYVKMLHTVCVRPQIERATMDASNILDERHIGDRSWIMTVVSWLTLVSTG